MGVHWYPGAFDQHGQPTDPWAEVSVPDPEHGRVELRRLSVHGDHADDHVGVYAGEQIAALLDQVTHLALAAAGSPPVTIRSTTGRSFTVTRAEAVELLPMLQRAAVLATAGTDRYERVWNDDDTLNPPLCVRCNQGSHFHHAVTISLACNEYGHTPFGTTRTWDQAQQHHISAAIARAAASEGNHR